MENRFLKFSELEPLCLLRLLARNLWLIVMAALIGFFSSSAFLTLDASRSYSSDATFVVIPNGGSYYSNLRNSVSAAGSYAPLLESTIMYQTMQEHLSESCEGQIDAQQLGETNLISVTITSDNPKDALLMMQALVDSYEVLNQYVSSSVMLQLLNTPSMSTLVSGTFSSRRLVPIATVGGAVLMVGILLLISMVNGTVQTTEGARKLLDAKVISTIPHERQLSKWIAGPRRTKRSTNITSPNVSFSFAESIHRISSKMDAEHTKGRKVFLLTSVSESEGKSTVAVNVALSLAMKKASVLFLDLDLRRPVQARNLNMTVPEELELGMMLSGKLRPQEILARVQTDLQSGLRTLLSTRTYPGAAELIASPTLLEVIRLAREQYDYVIIDLPPIGYFAESEVMLNVADASMLVVRQDVVPATVINDSIDALREGKAAFLGCILNDMNTLHASRSSNGYGKYGYGKYGYGYGYGYQNRSQDRTGK